MNWALYILGALVVILTVIQIWWDYLLKYFFKDARTNEHKSLRKRFLVLTLSLFVLNQFIGIVNSHQKDQQAKSDKQELTRQIGLLTNQLSIINSSQVNLKRSIDSLSANPSIDPTARAAMIESKKQYEVIDSQVVDVNAWMSELADKRTLSKIQREQAQQKTQEEEKPIIEQCSPIFDYTIRKLQSIIAQLAKTNGVEITSTYVEIPSTLQSNITKVAEVSAGTNSVWNFSASITHFTPASPFSPPQLRIMFSQNHFNLFVSPTLYTKEVNTMIRVPNEDPILGKGSLEDYKSIIDEALRNLIAAQEEQLTRTNQ
jgi:hypothetical protein